MAKRKKTAPELPLFDLPLRPGEDVDGVDLLDDWDASDEGASDEEEIAAEDVAGPSAPIQTMLPDLVIEPPSRGRSEKSRTHREDSGPRDGSDPTSGTNGRDTAVTPRARLASKDPEDDSFDGEMDDAADEWFVHSLAAPLGERALAGLADLGINGLMLAIAALASHFVGVQVSLDLWVPFVGLSLVTSFLYWIIPLAFWGQTPGMAWLGNIARSFDDEPLSFGQALLRWLGAWITAGLLGLPQLLALGGRSLTDRLSDSKTLVLPDDLDD